MFNTDLISDSYVKPFIMEEDLVQVSSDGIIFYPNEETKITIRCPDDHKFVKAEFFGKKEIEAECTEEFEFKTDYGDFRDRDFGCKRDLAHECGIGIHNSFNRIYEGITAVKN